MPRIQGVDLPNPKPTYIALTYLYGIGRAKAIEICFHTTSMRLSTLIR